MEDVHKDTEGERKPNNRRSLGPDQVKRIAMSHQPQTLAEGPVPRYARHVPHELHTPLLGAFFLLTKGWSTSFKETRVSLIGKCKCVMLQRGQRVLGKV